MKYYCLHHLPLIDRRALLMESFKRESIDVEWVTGFLPSQITLPALSRFTTVNEYSLYLKHQYCLEQQIEKGEDIITVFEDDLIIPLNYKELERTFLQEFKDVAGDIMFQGICCNILPHSIVPNKHVYYDPSYTSRCTHCLTVTLSTAKRILSHLNTNHIAYDWKLNEVIKQEQLRSCYTVPGLLQGSETGKFNTSLGRQ